MKPQSPPTPTLSLRRRSVAGWLAAAAAPRLARAEPPSPRAVVVGQIALTFHQAVGAVVQVVLERLGVEYRVVEGSHGEVYPRLATGEVDLLAAAWLPNAHGPLHAAAADRTVELATLYEDARLYWAVPAYVPASQVQQVGDLLNPEVAHRMDKRIVGIGADSGLMRGAAQIVRDYGLAAAGYTLVTGPAQDWVRATRERIAAGAWCVVPLWQPQWMNRAFALRVLDEPKGIYQPDRCVLVASTSLRDRLGEKRWRALSRVQLDIATVTELDEAIALRNRTPLEAAREWAQREPERIAAWLGEMR